MRMKPLFAIMSLALSTSAFAGLREDVAAKDARVEALRQEVAALTQSLLVEDADLRVFLSLSPLVSAVASVNSRPPEGRLIKVRSRGVNGKFWEDGATWCHSYAELNSANGMWADAVLNNFSATVREDGGIVLSTNANVNGHVQVHFHFMGRRYNIRVAGYIVGNACPPGGGVGTSIGVGFKKVQDLSVLVSFAPTADGRVLTYTAHFTSPPKISVTANIGLGAIGTIGHPMSIDLPKTPFVSGTLPMLFSNEGVFKLPGNAGERAYSIVLVPKTFVSNSQGIQAQWKSTVQFKPAQK